MTTMSPCSLYWDSSKIFVPTLSNVPRCVHLSRGAEAATSTNFATISLRSSRTFGSQACSGSFVKPLFAAGSGLEASISDTDADLIPIKNAKIVVESQEETKMQVRVDLPGEETTIVFDKVVVNLGKTAPPVPGFRKEKGGKTSKIPKDFLLRILGEERVTKFVIQEIITSTLADYVKKENLTVKDNKINTIQTAEELRSLFVRGKEFGFNATIELETDTTPLELDTAAATAETSSSEE